ncbi:MAG: DUF4156 domain-containing protein [Calothrix sp. SM1_5_4]|nr:DUF4156 domain-containing protein [Calothrix sp. SM1_5_4]
MPLIPFMPFKPFMSFPLIPTVVRSVIRSALVSFALISALGACAHKRSVLPEVKEVKVGREPAGDECKEIGPINGTVADVKATREQALEDLKKEAANKGANYVMIKQYSAYGTSVVGIAYECP